MKKRIVVLISGGGSNLQALIAAVEDGVIDAEIVAVVSNRKHAYGLVRAEKAGIATRYYPLRPFRGDGLPREKLRAAYDVGLAGLVAEFRPNLIVLAGFMLILGERFLNRFPHQIINLHPALPGEFAGTHAIERAWEAHQRGEITRSGCMVHFAIPEVDAGAVLVQKSVPFEPNDTLESFERRLHQAEHEIIVAATIKALAV